MRTVFSLILLLGLAATICRRCGAEQRPGTKWQVTIENFQSSGDLTVHCKSKDDDLGEHVVPIKTQYSWEFRENFWKTTLYWCTFSSRLGHATFQVFWPEKRTWLSERCDFENCFWFTKDDGIYLRNTPTGGMEFMHRWEAGS